jgi:outer membrane protein OmpA-like peptidoglycan-associated protein
VPTLLVSSLALLAGQVRAQQLDLGLLSPTPSPALTFTLPAPGVPPHGALGVGLFMDYAHGPLDRRLRCAAQPGDPACVTHGTGSVHAEVAQLGRGVLLLDLALFNALELGLAVPVSIAHATPIGQDSMALQTHGGLGDLRFTLKGAFVPLGATRVGWSLDMSLPSAGSATWSGDRGATLSPALIVSQSLGRVTLGARAAYHLRRRTALLGIEQDDEFVIGLGAHLALTGAVAALAELHARLGVGGRSFDATELPTEIDLGLRLGAGSGMQLDVGVGSGARPGERGVGAPLFRGFLTLRATFETAPCERGPEDFDGYEDADGCADPDNDHDGLIDDQDACPNDAEDHDGFADKDGCPDPDNDADGLPDARDLCPERSEDRDGFQDRDGCPEPDNDADGVADGSDRCRLDPEDRDGFEDDDGCPEPGPGRPTVTVSGSRLLMSDRIYFEDEGDTISPASTLALDALAATLKSLPGQPRVRVEGHTDDSGNPQYNIDLSYRRARAVVEYLKAEGVTADRLEYVGRGSSVPLGPNRTPEGRALNRRVEFVLLDR